VGLLSKNTAAEKTLAAKFRLHEFGYPWNRALTEEETINLPAIGKILSLSGNEQQRCAVLAFGNARLSARECDDPAGGRGPRVRSLPQGVLKRLGSGVELVLLPLRPVARAGGNADVPEEREVQLLVFIPGKEPVWHAVKLKKAARAPAPAPAPTSEPSSWQAVAQALSTYLSLNPANSDPLWMNEYNNAFCVALLCNGVEHLGVDDARALYGAYAELSKKYGKSPVFLHRALTLFLSMRPHEAHTFLAGIKGGGQPFVTEFFQSSGLGAILENHLEETVDEALVSACLRQMDADLAKWKRETFDPQKTGVFRTKDARPDLWIAYLQAYEYQNRGAIPYEQKEAIEAAIRLFEDDTIPHVCYPYCLWKAIPILTWQDVLRPYFPRIGDAEKAEIERRVRDATERVVREKTDRQFRDQIFREIGEKSGIKLRMMEQAKREHPGWGDRVIDASVSRSLPRAVEDRAHMDLSLRAEIDRRIQEANEPETLAYAAREAIASRIRSEAVIVKSHQTKVETEGLHYLARQMIEDWVIEGSGYVCDRQQRLLRQEGTGVGNLSLLHCSRAVLNGQFSLLPYESLGILGHLEDNPEDLRPALFAFASIMGKFTKPSDSGFQLMYALGRFMHAIREQERSHGGQSAPEFKAIQNATGARNLQEFLKGDVWITFVQQVVDNSIGDRDHGRCRDGIYDALRMGLPTIIQPELPSMPPVFLWGELMLQDYRKKWMKLFDSHISNDEEEGTYGPPRLGRIVNPIFSLPGVSKSGYLLDEGYIHGRSPVKGCLEPMKMGLFPEDDGYIDNPSDADNPEFVFLSAGRKKNTTIRPQGDFSFTYITRFSPVEVLYRAARSLFSKWVTGNDEEKDALSALESAALDDILRLLLNRPEIRNEYLGFIAAFPDGKVTDEQETRWGFDPADPRAVAPSFRSIAYVSINDTSGNARLAERAAALNAHLCFWKTGIHNQKVYFFPSVEACKALAFDLGYVREGADLTGYQYVPPVPDFEPSHNRPVPPAGSFYKHFNLYGERIDVDPTVSNSADPRSPNHPRNREVPVQPKEPENFVGPYTWDELVSHADERQQLFYEVFCPGN
jgi:hypothetical protein